MDNYGSLMFNPHLYMVLKTFQSAAESSLRGPSGYLSAWTNNGELSSAAHDGYKRSFQNYYSSRVLEDAKVFPPHPAQFRMPPLMPIYANAPVLFSRDDSSSRKCDTLLKGENISCFQVGGEFRLCLPQILNTLLRPFSMEQVYEASNELHIYFSRCTYDQLLVLKACGILPESAANCGLITKTDAERLCHKLLDNSPKIFNNEPTRNSFKVFHECFGKCKGIIIPELYSSIDSACIECCECRGLFTPDNFVCHSHRMQEVRTCHWGFDSANWRAYLLLARNQEPEEHYEKMLEDFKLKLYMTQSEKNLHKRQVIPLFLLVFFFFVIFTNQEKNHVCIIVKVLYGF